MLSLPLQNSANETIAPSQQKHNSQSLSSICAVSLMAGILLADILPDITFLMIILGLACLSSFHPLSQFGFTVSILALLCGGFATTIEQVRFHNILLATQIDGFFTATIMRAENQAGHRKRLFLVNLKPNDGSDLSAIIQHEDIIRAVIDFHHPVSVSDGDMIAGNLRLYPLSDPLFP